MRSFKFQKLFQEQGGIVWLRETLALILCALFLTPMFRFLVWEVILAFLCAWFAVAYLSAPDIFKKIFFKFSLLNLASYTWAFSSIILMFLGKYKFMFGGLYNILIILMVYFGKYYLTLNNKRVFKLLYYYIMLIIVVLCFGTLIGNVKFENLSRLYANGNNDAVIKIANPFVGGYPFVYIIVFVTGAYTAIIRRTETNVLQIAILTLMLAMILVTQYTMAILFAIILVVSNIIYVKPQTSSWQKFQIYATMFAVLFIILCGSDIFAAVAKLFKGDILEARFNELSQMLRFDKSIDEIGLDMSIRFELYSESINAFKQNVFSGVGQSAVSGIVGGHSTLFDEFATYGLLGGIPFTMFVLAIAHDYCINNKENRWVFVYSYVIVLCLLVVNTFSNPPMYFGLAFIIPIIIKQISLRKSSIDYVDSDALLTNRACSKKSA